MKISTVRELARLMKEYDLTGLELNTEDGKLRLERAVKDITRQMVNEPTLNTVGIQPASIAPAPVKSTNTESEKDDPGMDFNDVTAVTAPMVGVFYASPAPGEPPYVKVGSRVKKGDVLCVLEAMKTMNEITAGSDGEIVDICASDGDVVEFGQTLFKLY